MNEPNIITRLSLPNESAEIYEMQRSLAAETQYDQAHFHLTEAIVQGVLTDPEQSRYYSALRRNELVGMILCHRIPFSWLGNPGVYVEDLYVQKRFRRGLDIGTLLMARASEWAIELAGGEPNTDRAYVRLDTDLGDWNAGTRAFYENRIGYGDKAKRMVNYRFIGDAVQTNAEDLRPEDD